MTLKALFSRKWIIPTILVVLGMIMLARLGVWQWDRLQQKRAFNTMASERWRMTPFDLNTETLPPALEELEYRRVAAEGEFDYDRQILISNQVFNSTAGYVLVTPLVLADKSIFGPGNPPMPFEIPYSPGTIRAGQRFALEARIEVGGKLRFYSMAAHPVTLENVTEPHEVWVELVK